MFCVVLHERETKDVEITQHCVALSATNNADDIAINANEEECHGATEADQVGRDIGGYDSNGESK